MFGEWDIGQRAVVGNGRKYPLPRETYRVIRKRNNIDESRNKKRRTMSAGQLWNREEPKKILLVKGSTKGGKEHKEEKLQLAAIQCRWLSVIISVVICTNDVAPSREKRVDGSSARILSNDFTFTPWLSTLATFWKRWWQEEVGKRRFRERKGEVRKRELLRRRGEEKTESPNGRQNRE